MYMYAQLKVRDRRDSNDTVVKVFSMNMQLCRVVHIIVIINCFEILEKKKKKDSISENYERGLTTRYIIFVLHTEATNYLMYNSTAVRKTYSTE